VVPLALAAWWYGLYLGNPVPVAELLPWRAYALPILLTATTAMLAAALARPWLTVLLVGSYLMTWILCAPGVMHRLPSIPVSSPGAGPESLYWWPQRRPPDLRPIGALVRRHVPPDREVLFAWV
jgi:hypothetical protein